uniref:Uncharacterized protein n=1 Tax=Oryza sativa subsp. japonica TaxID=39947 RepID=Q6Z5V2_ORYSJ|nr:hypothetical protein [Oryza sativa Japonica Group]
MALSLARPPPAPFAPPGALFYAASGCLELIAKGLIHAALVLVRSPTANARFALSPAVVSWIVRYRPRFMAPPTSHAAVQEKGRQRENGPIHFSSPTRVV